MGARLRRIGGEAAKFSAVNVVATVVAIVLFNLLVHGITGVARPGPLNGWPVTAWFLANCVGMAISFYGSSRFAFKHREASGPAGGALIFVAINLVSFVIPMGCLWITRNVAGWDSVIADNVSANVVGAALGMLVRFWAFRRFVFKRPPAVLPPQALLVPADYVARHRDRPSALPELGPDEPELVEHQPEQGKADPHHVVRVSGDARHEGATEAVEGEGSRDG
jgi:putative flippase GtrA